MRRSKLAKLKTRLDELQAEVDILTARFDLTTPTPNPTKYEPIEANPAISKPLDVHALAEVVNEQHSYYDEAGDVYGPGTYL